MAAAGRLHQAEQHPDGGGLARPVRAEEAVDRAARDGQADAVNGDLSAAKALGQPPVAVEWTLPLVRPGGAVVLWLGPTANLAAVATVAELLGGGPISQLAPFRPDRFRSVPRDDGPAQSLK